jgi:formate hydrogenlyase subunit 4
MSLISLVIVLIVIGLLLWLANTYIPMDATIKKILNVVVVIAVVLWLLSVFGIFDSMSAIHVGSQHHRF